MPNQLYTFILKDIISSKLIFKGRTKLPKETMLLKEIIINHHPEFIKSRDLIKVAKLHPEYFNIYRLVEESLAAASDGRYQFIDDAHADFDDGSDSKTASISEYSKKGDITNVVTAGGNHKDGSLRCTIYNPITERLMYYFLPKRFWKNHVIYHPTSKIGKLVFSYNYKYDEIVKFAPYRCHSFKDLAQR